MQISKVARQYAVAHHYRTRHPRPDKSFAAICGAHAKQGAEKGLECFCFVSDLF